MAWTSPAVKVIYGKPMLSDLARVLACLYEKEIMFELEDMNKGRNISQEILNLQISSHGHTPALIDGQEELYGSRKICRHIADKYGAYGYPDLLGKDPLARVSIEQWIQSEEHIFDPSSSALVFYLAYKIEINEEKTSNIEKKLGRVLNLYEQRLGECEFLAGHYFTLADLYHLPNTYYLEGSVEYGYLFKDRKNVSRWWKSISNRNSWKKVVTKFEADGLQFDAIMPGGRIDHTSSQSKNGVKIKAAEGLKTSHIFSKQNKGKSDIPEIEGGIKGLANNKKGILYKVTKDDEAVQLKIDDKNRETPFENNQENNYLQSANENKNLMNDKEAQSSAGGQKDEALSAFKSDPNKLGNEDKKEMLESTDIDKPSLSSKENSEIIDLETNKQKTDSNKKSVKSDDQFSSVNRRSDLMDESKELESDKKDVGGKDAPVPDDKDKVSSDKAEKPSKIDESIEHKTESQNDVYNSEENTKASSENKAENNSENDNGGTSISENQGNRKTSGDDGNNISSSATNKSSNSKLLDGNDQMEHKD